MNLRVWYLFSEEIVRCWIGDFWVKKKNSVFPSRALATELEARLFGI